MSTATEQQVRPFTGMRVRIDGDNAEGELVDWCDEGAFVRLDGTEQVVSEPWHRVAAVIEVEACDP